MSSKSNLGIFNVSGKTAAKIAGFSLFLMTLAAVFSIFLVFEKVWDRQSIAKTYNNIVNSGIQFVLSIAGLYFIAILDFVIAWGTYIYFKPVNRILSSLAASFRIIYGFIFMYAILLYAEVTQILSQASVLGQSKPEMVMNSLFEFEKMWKFALIFFAIHLILLGIVALKSNLMLKITGVLLIIAGFGYLIDSVGYLFVQDYNLKLAEKVFMGELVLMFWLIIDGFRKKDTFKSHAA